ncbi:hypothetical protein [Absidia glauca]|uniref:RING-type domain-containing protein n=1 Tax=Absidia glauca TaxID=4829 RepID=A0A163KPG6_ABSGL|nr:hypothetical protein [Absidia glauca]
MGVRHSKQADHSDDPLDFGSLVPLNTDTTATWDYDTKVVKRLIKEGRLAPFYQGYYDRPDIRNGSQVDLLTSASHGLLQQTTLAVKKNESSMLAMAAERMGLLLARHIPENVQRYVLYKDSVECPICFLYYPPFINHTRCCDKLICTECFLQLKRSVGLPSLAIHCPFCMQPHLGVIRIPPPWSLHYASFCDRRFDFVQDQSMGKRKRLYIFDPDVVLVDHVRPDWQENIGSSSRNTSSNGSTRRTVVRPLQAATIDLVSNISSSVESTDSMPEDFLVMEYLRLGTMAARQGKESVTHHPASTQIQSPSSSSLSHF